MIVGMDFGTTNSGMAVYDGADLNLIPLDLSNRNPYITRTAMYITNDRQVYIGRQAIDTYYEQNLNRPVKIEKVIVGEITLDFADLPSFKKYVYVEDACSCRSRWDCRRSIILARSSGRSFSFWKTSSRFIFTSPSSAPNNTYRPM
jgi:hypothetical protein